MNASRVFLAGLAVVLALGAVGCKSVEEKVGEEIAEEIIGQSTGTNIEVEGDSVTVETEDGDVTMSSTTDEMPDGFPSDFPIYDGAEIDGTSTIDGETSTDHYVNLLSADVPLAVYEWYKAELVSAGWEIESDMKVDDETMLFSGKQGAMTYTLAIGAEDTGSSIAIIVSTAK